MKSLPNEHSFDSLLSEEESCVPFLWKYEYNTKMIRTLVIFLSVVVFSISPGHLNSARGQGKGTLSVTTTPVSGAIYIDYVFKGSKFWSGDLDSGPHAVSFGDMEGYITPSLQMVTVITDQTLYVIGAYRKLFSSLKPPLVTFSNESFCCSFRNDMNWEQGNR